MSTSFSLNNVFKSKYHTCFNIRLISFKTLIAFGSPFSAFSKIICNLSSRTSAVFINLFTSILSKSTLLQNIKRFKLISIYPPNLSWTLFPMHTPAKALLLTIHLQFLLLLRELAYRTTNVFCCDVALLISYVHQIKSHLLGISYSLM